MSAEFDLVCHLVRPAPRLAAAREILRRGIDVDALLQTAEQNCIRPRLIAGLAAMSWNGMPASAQASLADFRRVHLVRALSAAQQLSRVAEALTAAGVRFAAFKGATLAKQLYGDLSAREYSDIDLIVPKPQVGEAEDVLAALGYCGDGDRAFRGAFQAYLRQYGFVHPELGVAIDLHWNFSGSHVPFPLDPDEIWDGLEQVPVGYLRVPAVSGANLALLLAGHGTKEGWRSLDWVCDFAMLVHRRPDLDWTAIHRRAEARGCGDSVLLACTVVHRLLDMPVPAALQRPAVDRRRVRAVAGTLVDELRRHALTPRKTENLSDLELCDTRRDRIGAVLKLAFTRTVGDYQAMPLPPELWRVYHATRPFRLAAKAITGRGR
jgi:Uncharacterised nucleotidyltransferase